MEATTGLAIITGSRYPSEGSAIAYSDQKIVGISRPNPTSNIPIISKEIIGMLLSILYCSPNDIFKLISIILSNILKTTFQNKNGSEERIKENFNHAISRLSAICYLFSIRQDIA